VSLLAIYDPTREDSVEADEKLLVASLVFPSRISTTQWGRIQTVRVETSKLNNNCTRSSIVTYVLVAKRHKERRCVGWTQLHLYFLAIQ
jgi:hypothetical protein